MRWSSSQLQDPDRTLHNTLAFHATTPLYFLTSPSVKVSLFGKEVWKSCARAEGRGCYTRNNTSQMAREFSAGR
jgi:hypothetical protein